MAYYEDLDRYIDITEDGLRHELILLIDEYTTNVEEKVNFKEYINIDYPCELYESNIEITLNSLIGNAIISGRKRENNMIKILDRHDLLEYMITHIIYPGDELFIQSNQRIDYNRDSIKNLIKIYIKSIFRSIY